ncbi:MAG: acetyl-CoA hydrolase/transferase C-terminal domain-containing protein [Bacteroidaceae bacterium]|jgi:succinate CoA transferase|nr:acetyl-CoA hydrolase/transferase C-terminal domain-containing protein [Bacteroidaceae bacterium]
MELNKLTAQEVAEMIQDGDDIGLSGFTPAGVPKMVPHAISEKALREHEAGRPFKINVYTGASTGQSCDGDLTNAQAIHFRAPYTTNKDFRRHVNADELEYQDMNLSNMATQLRQGNLGNVDWAIIEVSDIDIIGDKAQLYLTAAVGISPTVCRMAKKGIFLEYNLHHAGKMRGIHDVYEVEYHPYRTPINMTGPMDRIGKPYIEIPVDKIRGVVECNIADEARSFTAPSDTTDQIGQNVANFLLDNLRNGLIPKTFLNIQSGVGSTANAVLGAMGNCEEIPNFGIYTEVLQNSAVELLLSGRVTGASACSLTITDAELQKIYANIEFFKKHLILRPSEISNNPEVIARIGVCAMNTAIEADIYGHVNSTKICGTKMMNGIGGSADFTNNAYLSIFSCGSTTKEGKISSIVPFCSHIDHTSHFVDAVITEYGVADLRGIGDMERAKRMIAIAHPDYRPMLNEYLTLAAKYGGEVHHVLSAAFAMHDTFRRKGDMHLTDWSEYIKD